MAFTTIPSGWLDVGDPTKKEIFDYIKANEDDLDTRVSDVEAATTNETPIQFQVTGPYWNEGTTITDAAHVIRIPFYITITSGRLQITDDGSSGTLTTDVKYSDDSGSTWATIFSSVPTVAQGSGDYTQDAGVLLVTDLDAGDLLRLDLTAVMTGNERFNVYLTWEIRT